MTNATLERLLWELHEDRQPIVEMAVHYAQKSLSALDEMDFRRRMETDPDFRAVAQPILESMQERPLDDEEFARHWQNFRRRMGMSTPGSDAEPLDPELLDFQRRASRRPSMSWRVVKIAAVIFVSVIALSSGVIAYLQIRYMDRYSAPVTGSTRLTLPDGSVAELAGGSNITLLKGMQSARGIFRREVWMDGEVTFTVHPDGPKRFVVHATGARVTARGTRFTVRELDSGVEVRLYEGIVVVQPVDAADGETDIGNPRQLNAGETARVTGAQVVVFPTRTEKAP
jgi:ferric-dicitrate binding protein FerR (iron transport regulator)